MREFIEFRIPEKHASKWLKSADGVVLGGSVRKLEIEACDPRMQIIEEADRELKQQGRVFFASWRQRRTYSSAEIEAARLFELKITAIFEPPGEMCDTEYDETVACERCGAGAKQVGPLILEVNRIPKRKNFARTIAGEIVVDQHVVDFFKEAGVTGVQFYPVQAKRARTPQSTRWYQLVILLTGAEVIAPTRIGNDPFDDDPTSEYRCPNGDLMGLNLLSEAHVLSSSITEDITASHKFVGVRRGVLRPERIMFVSPKVYKTIKSNKMSGCEFEVAHLL